MYPTLFLYFKFRNEPRGLLEGSGKKISRGHHNVRLQILAEIFSSLGLQANLKSKNLLSKTGLDS
jgi:hypothetical protein